MVKLQHSKFGNATSKSIWSHCSEILFWHHLHESLSGYCGDQADNRHNMSLYLFFLIFRLRCPGGQPLQITFKRTKHVQTVIVIILVQVWLNMIMTLQKIDKTSPSQLFNPIPTTNGLNQPIYSYHVTRAGRNRVKC